MPRNPYMMQHYGDSLVSNHQHSSHGAFHAMEDGDFDASVGFSKFYQAPHMQSTVFMGTRTKKKSPHTPALVNSSLEDFPINAQLPPRPPSSNGSSPDLLRRWTLDSLTPPKRRGQWEGFNPCSAPSPPPMTTAINGGNLPVGTSAMAHYNGTASPELHDRHEGRLPPPPLCTGMLTSNRTSSGDPTPISDSEQPRLPARSPPRATLGAEDDLLYLSPRTENSPVFEVAFAHEAQREEVEEVTGIAAMPCIVLTSLQNPAAIVARRLRRRPPAH